MANPKTPGDLYFERYCDVNGYLWWYEPGSELLGREMPTKPDYLTERGGDRAVVEVKHFTTMRETERLMASPTLTASFGGRELYGTLQASIRDAGELFAPTRRPLEVLDLVRIGSTTEAAVEYMRQTTYTNAAVEIAEATSTTTGTTPEATLPFEKISSPVESVDSWVPATRRALADKDELRGLIDDQLLHDARRRLEAQLLAGNGTSPNLRGLDNTTGVQAQAKGADSVPLALAKGIALAIVAGYQPTAVVLHPDDWTDAIGPLITAGGSLRDTLEVPVVKTAAVAAGTGYVGDWRQLVVWMRSTDVYVSNSHSDYLIHNLVAIMGEIRAAVGVLAPAAFVRVTGI